MAYLDSMILLKSQSIESDSSAIVKYKHRLSKISPRGTYLFLVFVPFELVCIELRVEPKILQMSQLLSSQDLYTIAIMKDLLIIIYFFLLILYPPTII